MNILITGVNGLLGYEVAKLLCNNPDHTIYGLARTSQLVQAENYKHIRTDLQQAEFITLLPQKLDAVFHFAQSEKFRNFPQSALEVFDTNTVSTLKLLEYARQAGAGKFIYASSGGVYGNKDIGFTEDSPVMGNGELGFYLSTKLCSEILADNYSVFFDVIQLRFFFVYGERQNKTMLIPRLVNSVLNRIPIILAGTGGIKINPVYVVDAAHAVVNTLKLSHSDKINIGGTEDLSIKEIAETISAKTGIEPIFEYTDSEPKNLIGDIQKMKHILFTPAINFEMGVDKLIKSISHE
ncbi:MAG: NAD(P)-dependent oxidoreductase [Bacteroidetes bacterium]|nr:NAD(P)-dependent oxidoreductase [Bacteroidota bacterium]